ncbi:MAG: hypothetical protein IT440_05295, partial [Phycisphaeraceae bacterium]|nr:hypothetical protein [Phycisphaeraceae bacterium]
MQSHRRRSGSLMQAATVLVVLILCGQSGAESIPATQPAATQPATRPATTRPAISADELRKNVLQAYLHTDTYAVSKKVTLSTTGGPANQNHTFEYIFAFDRKGQRLALQSQPIKLVAGDGHVRVHLGGDRYLDRLTDKPLSEAALRSAWPTFDLLMGTPDLSMLIEGANYEFLAGAQVTLDDAATDPADPRWRLRLTDSGGGAVTFAVDPDH